METNFGKNWQNDLHLAGWRSKTGRNKAVLIQKYSMNIVATSCANLTKIGPVTPEVVRETTAPFWARRQKSAYPTKYLRKYKTDLHQLFALVDLSIRINKLT